MEIPLPLLSKAEGGQWPTKGGEGLANGKSISFKTSCSAHVLHTIPAGAQSLQEKQDEAGCTPKSRLSMSITLVFPLKGLPGAGGRRRRSRSTLLQYSSGRSLAAMWYLGHGEYSQQSWRSWKQEQPNPSLSQSQRGGHTSRNHIKTWHN